MPNSFDERVRLYLKRFGERFSLNQSSGLYQPYSKPSPEPSPPTQASEILPRQGGKDTHTPITVEVRRDRVAILVPAILSFLTLILLVATVIYTRRQWLEANRSANSPEIAAHAAQSAAETANDTLNEMKTDAQTTLSTNKDATHLDQRAWVGLSQPEAVPTDTGHLVKGFEIINSGKTPANDVHVAAGVYAHNIAPSLYYAPTEGDYDWIRYILRKTQR